MSVSFARYPAEDVEIWRAHPLTEFLVAALKAEHQDVLKRLEIAASSGNEHQVLCAFGGKCAQLRALIQAIEGAKGAESE